MKGLFVIISCGTMISIINLALVYYYMNDYFVVFVQFQLIYQLVSLLIERPVYIFNLTFKLELFAIFRYAMILVGVAFPVIWVLLDKNFAITFVVLALFGPAIGLATAFLRNNSYSKSSVFIAQVIRPKFLAILLIIINMSTWGQQLLLSSEREGFILLCTLPTITLGFISICVCYINRYNKDTLPEKYNNKSEYFLLKSAFINSINQIFGVVITYTLSINVNEAALMTYRLVERGSVVFKTLQSIITTRSIIEIKSRKDLCGSITIKSKKIAKKLGTIFCALSAVSFIIYLMTEGNVGSQNMSLFFSFLLYYCSYLFSINVGPIGTLLMLSNKETQSTIIHFCNFSIVAISFGIYKYFFNGPVTLQEAFIFNSINITLLNLIFIIYQRRINDSRPSA